MSFNCVLWTCITNPAAAQQKSTTCWWLFSPENHAFQQILAFDHVRIFRLRRCPRKGNVPALAPGQCRTCQCRKLTTCWKAPYWVLLKSRSWKAACVLRSTPLSNAEKQKLKSLPVMSRPSTSAWEYPFQIRFAFTTWRIYDRTAHALSIILEHYGVRAANCYPAQECALSHAHASWCEAALAVAKKMGKKLGTRNKHVAGKAAAATHTLNTSDETASKNSKTVAPGKSQSYKSTSMTMLRRCDWTSTRSTIWVRSNEYILLGGTEETGSMKVRHVSRIFLHGDSGVTRAVHSPWATWGIWHHPMSCPCWTPAPAHSQCWYPSLRSPPQYHPKTSSAQLLLCPMWFCQNWYSQLKRLQALSALHWWLLLHHLHNLM